MTDKPTDIFGAIEITAEKQSAKTVVKSSRSGGKKKKPIERKERSSSKRLIWFGLAIFLLAAYSAAGYLLVPYLVKTVLPDSLKDKGALVLSIQNVRFNPFNFRLDIGGLSLETSEDRQSTEQLLSVEELKIDLDFLSLLRGDLVCSTVDMAGLDLRIIRNEDKSYNISYLLRGSSLQNQSDIIDFAELPFLFSLNNIKISGSRVTIYDRITKKDHLIDNIELALPVISNFDYRNSFYIQPRFSAVVNGSPITLTGEAALGMTGQQGKQTQLSCDLNDIDIPLYFDYLPVALPVDITQGKANGKLQLIFSPEQEKGSKVKVEFSLTVNDLTVESRNGKLRLSVPEASFAGSLEPFANTISLENVLFREPAITSEGEISRDTLASLAPLTLRPAADDPLHQVIPSLSIKLLIADGGSFTVQEGTSKVKRSDWKSVQLSIKNFTNEQTDSPEVERSFRLSGEHQSSSAFFTWQGTFDAKNQPAGNLQLNDIPASLIAPFFGKTPADVSGTAEVSGLLNIVHSDKTDKPFDYSLKSTRVSIRELQIKDQGAIWLRTPVFRCEPVSRIGGINDLGNVFMQDSTAVINRLKLPYLFHAFSAQSAKYIIHGIDFSGSLKIVESNEAIPLLDLKTVTFQANKLEQQELQKDNFVFSAQLKENEDIQAKGSFHITPLQISAQLSADNLSPRQLLSWFSSSKTFLTSKGRISLKGTFQFPQQEFSGDLRSQELLIGDPAKPVLQAANLNLAGFSWSKTNKNLRIKDILVDQPEFSWRHVQNDQNPATLVSIFLRHIFLPEPDSNAADPDIALSRYSLAIDQVGLTDGAISYHDERTMPPLALGLTGIKGSMQGIRYPVGQEDATIKLVGNIEGHPFTIETAGNLMLSPPSARFSFNSAALPLSLFTAQIETKMKGINVAGATATISNTAVLTNSDNSGRAALVLKGLSPQKSGTPAATTLAVLSKADGSISAEFQYESGNEWRGILSEALDHFARTMIKGSLNPLLISGPEFKDLVEEQFVSFSPGTASLTPESIERLSRYGQFLATHPLVNLEITGFSDQSADTPVLRAELMTMEQKRVDDDNRSRALEIQRKQIAEEAARQDALSRGAKGSTIRESDLAPKELFTPAAPRAVSVTNKMLYALATLREKAVLDHLIEGLSLPSDRIRIGSGNASRIKTEGNFTRALIALADGFKVDGEKQSN